MSSTLDLESRPLPPDHPHRLSRALRCLDGLSVGDSLGECFLSGEARFGGQEVEPQIPSGPWRVTDDTIRALSIVRCLRRHGCIHQQALAEGFAAEYRNDPTRGYGRGAHAVLTAISSGVKWSDAARLVFAGKGSCGNGGAMRAAPVGAYFAEDPQRILAEARASAEITHAHPDGQTGAIAVALAAGWMVNQTKLSRGHALIEHVLAHLPRTETFENLQKALELPLDTSPAVAGERLGNGSQVTASDTVPFCLWCVGRHPDNFAEALRATIRGFGDIDTNCAIVGGIIASGHPGVGIPPAWLEAREGLGLEDQRSEVSA